MHIIPKESLNHPSEGYSGVLENELIKKLLNYLIDFIHITALWEGWNLSEWGTYLNCTCVYGDLKELSSSLVSIWEFKGAVVAIRELSWANGEICSFWLRASFPLHTPKAWWTQAVLEPEGDTFISKVSNRKKLGSKITNKATDDMVCTWLVLLICRTFYKSLTENWRDRYNSP